MRIFLGEGEPVELNDPELDAAHAAVIAASERQGAAHEQFHAANDRGTRAAALAEAEVHAEEVTRQLHIFMTCLRRYLQIDDQTAANLERGYNSLAPGLRAMRAALGGGEGSS